MPRAVIGTSLKVKGQARLLLRLKVCHIYRKELQKLVPDRACAISTATSSYKGLLSWVLARGRRHTVSAASGVHAACLI